MEHQAPPLQGPGVQPQPFVGYPQQALQRVDSVPFSKPWHVAKLVLATLSMVWSIIIYGLGLYLLGLGSSYESSFQFSFLGSCAGLAIVWNTAEFVTICASRKRHGIHPGAHVALHLLVWLLAAVAVGYLGFFVSVFLDAVGSYSSYYYYAGDGASSRRVGSIDQALLAFASLLLVTHFVLFVRACVETSQHNHYRCTVYVPVAVPQTGGYYTVAPQPYLPYGPVQAAPPDPKRVSSASFPTPNDTHDAPRDAPSQHDAPSVSPVSDEHRQ